ncbi:hypothetical protein L596_011584 [Steinernema carpocapsae]|uniref:Uncharacterized protein n=1 Tax=Steinernema carpocapsae TaxID=34508 RepID=A0A4U5NUF6_STECR|nr:hypothetical protein L596_011584 [Steinernema carpocapsae]
MLRGSVRFFLILSIVVLLTEAVADEKPTEGPISFGGVFDQRQIPIVFPVKTLIVVVSPKRIAQLLIEKLTVSSALVLGASIFLGNKQRSPSKKTAASFR